MRQRKLAKKIRKEMALRTSPWRNVLGGYLFKGIGKGYLTVFIGLIGISASIKYNDWTWFARSGCIISIFGVLLIVSNFENELDGKSRINKLGELDPHATDDRKIDILNFCKNVDAFVFILGNLVWGFGDLLGKI